jgi:hypothetical protein
MFESIRNSLGQLFPSSQYPLSDETEPEIPLRDDPVVLFTHRPNLDRNLPITGDLNCLFAYNLLKFYKCRFELDTEGVPDMATFPNLQVPFLVTKISSKSYNSVYDYLEALKGKPNSQPTTEYLTLKFAIEKYCYDAFYRWLWNDPEIYRSFTLDFYSYRYHPLVRRYHMHRIYGKHFIQNYYIDKVKHKLMVIGRTE